MLVCINRTVNLVPKARPNYDHSEIKVKEFPDVLEGRIWPAKPLMLDAE